MASHQRVSGSSDFITSISIAAVLFFLISSSITFKLTDESMNNGALMRDSRLSGITTNSLHIISENIENPVIAMGSSMTLKALDGRCVTENSNSEAVIHNLAQVNSMPWNDMIHIPRIIELKPAIVMLEIGPNILSNLTSEKMLEYSELRYKTDSVNQDNSDMGGWYELLDPRLKQHIATDDFMRMEFRQEYVADSIEEQLNILVFNESKARKEWTYGWVPAPGMINDWLSYLQTPPFPPDRHGFDGMDELEREEYNSTKMGDSVNYNPTLDSYGQRVLDYEINALIGNDIPVILVVLPQHSDSLDVLSDSAWDDLNKSIEGFAEIDGVYSFNQLWEDGWSDDHFFDRNHLDDEGRIEFCHRLAPVIDQVLNE